jgi:hypothetical protein
MRESFNAVKKESKDEFPDKPQNRRRRPKLTLVPGGLSDVAPKTPSTAESAQPVENVAPIGPTLSVVEPTARHVRTHNLLILKRQRHSIRSLSLLRYLLTLTL